MHTIERQLQQNLNNIQEGGTRNGFKFSKSKTMYAFLSVKKST